MSSTRRYLTPLLVVMGLACTDEPVTSPVFAPTAREGGQASDPAAAPSHVVYVTTNDPTPGQNAVLAFSRNENCSLTVLGRFSMRGTGTGNPNFRLGTLDSDQSLVVSPDRNLLFAVNSGSDQVVVFSMLPNGSLEFLESSPSGGNQPATVGIRDKYVYVAHKNEDPSEPGSAPPNYTAFKINPHGKLHAISGSTIQLPQGSSPTQVLVSNDGQFVFSTELLVDFPQDFYPTDGFPAAPGAGGGNTLRSFVIEPNGRLRSNPGTRMPGPDHHFPDPLGMLSGSMHISGTTNGALGLQDHPVEPILYVAYPLRFQMGVYAWDRTTGVLSFRTVVANSGQMISWIQVSPDGQFLYTVNRLDSTISVYDLSNPLNPVEVIFRDLRTVPGAMGGLAGQPTLTADGRCLYVLEQRITDGATDISANALHAFQTFGGFTELAPIDLGVLGIPRTARPQGIAAF